MSETTQPASGPAPAANGDVRNPAQGGTDSNRDRGPAGEPLNEAEAWLLQAAATGEAIDLKRRPVRASLLRELLLETRPGVTLAPAGLKIERAIIQGTLDLDGCTVGKPFMVRHSRFEGGGEGAAIILRDARLKRVGIHSCTTEGHILGDRADVENGLFLGGGVIKGTVMLRGATIGGALTLEGTEFGDGKVALLAVGIDVKGPVILRRVVAAGSVLVPRANLRSGIYADGAKIVGAPAAIDAESAKIGGDVLLGEADLNGVLSLASARIEGRLSGPGMALAAVPVALDARGLDVSHGILLDNARLRGSAVLESAAVGKSFQAEGIEIDGGETAIGADVIRLGGNWEMPRAKLIGELKFPGGRVEGQLRLTEARLFGTDVSIRADGSEVRGGVFLSRSTVLGMVRFPAAHMGNQFRLRGASIKVEAGTAILVSAATFGRDVELTDGFQSVGAIVIDQARIAGTLDLRGSHLVAAAIARGGLPMPVAKGLAPGRTDELALSLVDADVNRLVMPVTGEERPRGITDLSRARAASFEDYADAWPPPHAQRTQTASGRDIDHLVLDGFVYGHLSNPAGAPPGDAKQVRTGKEERVAIQRIRWLEGQSAGDMAAHFKPQAWIGLSQRLAQQGYVEDALKIDIARQRRERKSASVTAAARWQSRLLDWLALYGHNPWRTVVWMAVVVVLFAGLWGWAGRLCQHTGCFDETVFVVRNKDAYRDDKFQQTYPGFHALAYSFDVFVPFVAFGYEDHWRPNIEFGPLVELPLPLPVSGDKPLIGAPGKPPTIAITIGGILYVLSIVEAILGIVLTSLMVTGFTGIIKERGS